MEVFFSTTFSVLKCGCWSVLQTLGEYLACMHNTPSPCIKKCLRKYLWQNCTGSYFLPSPLYVNKSRPIWFACTPCPHLYVQHADASEYSPLMRVHIARHGYSYNTLWGNICYAPSLERTEHTHECVLHSCTSTYNIYTPFINIHNLASMYPVQKPCHHVGHIIWACKPHFR